MPDQPPSPEPGILRHLPRVDEILSHPRFLDTPSADPPPRALAREAARVALEEARERLRASGDTADANPADIAERARRLLGEWLAPSLRRAVNAAGVLLHTGLGRAPLSSAAQDAIAQVTAGYCTVQADTDTGGRMPREVHVQGLLQRLTGAEAALVVNNNAAATVLALSALAAGREVVVSRGEMVEIGGSFRLPEIIALAGCRLVEVGCTNRTHLRDYERVIGPETALLLSVHQSNYRIAGFASQVAVGELAELAHSRGLLCAHDLGSGALVDLGRLGLPHEPSVPESLAAGADVVFFSGDKLLGGPQCGIILGSAVALQPMRRSPFYRTFRVCKLTLAALESTLRLFLDPDQLPARHRVLWMLRRSPDELRARAEALAEAIGAAAGGWLEADLAPGDSEVGGGSLAAQPLPTVVVSLWSRALPAGELARRLRLCRTPVFSRIHGDRVLLDLRTVLPGEEALILAGLEEIGAGVAGEA